jgi:uncharacterized membrane protein YfcA
MLFGIPLGELAWLALAILVGGIATGILAGVFGIGGGAVIVPVLYETFRVMGVSDDVRMQLCVGTSIAIIVSTTLRSYRAHRRTGTVLEGVVRAWAIPAVAGVAVGAVIAAFAPAALFKIAFVVIAVFIAAKLLFARDTWQVGADLPTGPTMSLYGFVVGLCSSLMGVSGGSLSNLILTLHGKPMHNAIATSAGVGVPITIAGTLGYMLAGLPRESLMPPLSIGFVSLIGVVLLAPVSSFIAPYGARLAHVLSRRQLEIGFGVFLLLIAVRIVATLF